MVSLASRSITAALWGTGGSAIRIVLQLVTQILLARILGPSEFGIFAIGVIVISFSNFFADVGIAYGLIQKTEVSEQDVRFAFTWQIIIGSATTAAIVLSAPSIATFFGEEKAATVITILSVLCLINALTAPSSNLLKRSLNFKKIQMGQVFGYLIGYVLVGLPFALLGYGVWALVAAWMTLSIVNLIIVYSAVRHSLKPLPWHPASTGMLGYGIAVFFTNLVNWILLNIDRTIVGRMFSSAQMGLYSTSYNILFNPTGTLVGVVQPVFFSATAKVSDDLNRMRSAYISIISASLLLFMPCFGVMAAISNTLILAAYGSAWREAGDLFRAFALAMPVYLFTALTTPIIWTAGHGRRELICQLPLLPVWAVGCWVAATYSGEAVAWTVLAMYILRAILIAREAVRATGIKFIDMIRSLKEPSILTLTVSAAALLSDNIIRQISVFPVMWVTFDIIVTGLVWVAVLRHVPSIINDPALTLLNRLIDRLPPRFAAAARTALGRRGQCRG